MPGDKKKAIHTSKPAALSMYDLFLPPDTKVVNVVYFFSLDNFNQKSFLENYF